MRWTLLAAGIALVAGLAQFAAPADATAADAKPGGPAAAVQAPAATALPVRPSPSGITYGSRR